MDEEAVFFNFESFILQHCVGRRPHVVTPGGGGCGVEDERVGTGGRTDRPRSHKI